MEIFQFVNFLYDDADFVIDYCCNIFIENLFFLVCDFQKSLICVFDFLFSKFEAELFATVCEAVSAGVSAQHHTRAAQADAFRGYNLVGGAFF